MADADGALAAGAEILRQERDELRARCKRLEEQHQNDVAVLSTCERDYKHRLADAALVMEVLARGVGTFQAGHEAPWDHGDNGRGGFVIEDNHGAFVMEVEEGEWAVPDGEDAEGFEERELQVMCDAVNLADDVSAALCERPGRISITRKTMARAAAIIRNARNEVTDP